MADVENRDELERRLARVVAKEQRAELEKLLKLLGDPPVMSNVPPEYWLNGFNAIQAAVMPILEEVFIDQAEIVMRKIKISVEWDTVNEDAARWARQYSYELVKKLTEKSREGLRQAVEDYYRSNLTLGDLQKRLERWFGPVRAEMISITEITRAAVEGELNLARRLEGQNANLRMVAYWVTNNDERVCPICGPRNDTRQGEGWTVPPPAHPRCRCWVRHEVEVKDA